LNFTSSERQISDDKGEASLPSAYQEEEFVHDVDQASEESFNIEANEKEDTGDFIGFNL